MLPIFSLKPAERLKLERVVAYTATLAAMALVLLFARKNWLTNDDIGMAMITGGYGITAVPTAGVVFSNVVWGWLLAHLPVIAGIEPYTLLTYAALLGSAAAILLALHRSGAPVLLGCSVVVVTFVPVLITPQFTFTAGYLAVAGLAVLLAWKDAPGRVHLWVAAALLLAAGLIRALEFLFVLGVSAPFLIAQWRSLPHRRWFAVALALLVLLGTAHLIDMHYYAATDWTQFQGMNRVRTAFTDYRLKSYFDAYPDSLAGAPVSDTDLGMISNWFYADPKVFDPANFQPLVHAVDWGQRLSLNLGSRGQWLVLLRDQTFLLCGAVLLLSLALLRRSIRPALVSLGLLLAAVILLQALGRAGMTRVYLPAMAAMALLYLMSARDPTRSGMTEAGALAMAAALFLTLYDAYPRVQGVEHQTAALDKALCSLPQEPLWVVWGNPSFPYQMLYRPGSQAHPHCAPQMYSLGSMQLAPFELDTVRRHTGAPDLVSALRGGKEIYLFTDPRRLSLLQDYFAVHYKTALIAEQKLEMLHLQVYALHAGGAATATPRPAAADGQDDDTGG